MSSIRQAKKKTLRWDRYRFKTGSGHPIGCCRAYSRLFRLQDSTNLRRQGQ